MKKARSEDLAFFLSELDAEVQLELVRVWTKGQWLDFVLTLVFDPVFDEVLGEHIACKQVLVVSL